MKLTISELRQLVKETLNENTDLVSASGEQITFGSEEHKNFLSNLIQSLIIMRDRQPRAGRKGYYAASRKIYNDAIRQLRRELLQLQ